MALVIVYLQGIKLSIRTAISSTIAVVAHEIISCQRRNLPDDALLIDDRNVIADEAIESMHIVESILAVMLVKILSLSNETALVEGDTTIIHRYRNIRWLDFLCTQYQVHIREEELCLGRIVNALGPVILLVGQARTVEDTGIHHDRETNIPGISYFCTHVANVTHLLGDERTVGKVLLMRRTVSIDGEWHTLLTDGELQGLPRLDACIGIEHLDLTLVAEVDFCLVAYLRCYIASHVDAGCTHLESTLPLFGLVLILRADGSTNFHGLGEFPDALLQRAVSRILGIHSHRHHHECHQQVRFLLHFLPYYIYT